MSPKILTNGPSGARWQLILAHGSGAPMDSDFMNTVAEGLAAEGLRVLRFEFPYMRKRRLTGKPSPPDRAPVLEASWREMVDRHPHPRQLIGGKSLGGRVAARVAPSLPVRAVICLGFPFHAPATPERTRLDDLSALTVPTLILQGTRDPFGTKSEVRAYRLPRHIQTHWLADANHSFEPPRSSGHTHAEHLSSAVQAITAFVRKLESADAQP